MNRRKGLRKKAGVVILPWLFIILMLGSLIWLLNRVSNDRIAASQCAQNLKTLYVYLQRYEQEHGTLPTLVLFSKDPENDPRGIKAVLSEMGVPDEVFICPSSPDVIRDHGVSYLWNPALNGGTLNGGEVRWMLVDIQAVDPDLPGPHLNRYHILFTDGHVEETDVLPYGLPLHVE